VIAKPYAILALVLLLGATHGAAYLQGFKQGSKVEAARWQAQEIERQQQAAKQAQALRDQLAERDAALARKTEEAAHAVAEVRTEYLPGKTIVRREVVEVPAYRDCRITGSVRHALDAALAGRPVPGAEAERGGAARVPGGT